MRQGQQRSIGQPRGDIGQQRFRQGGAGARQRIRIHREIADIAPEGAKHRAAALSEVTLAQFNEAPKGGQQAKASFHRNAGERIQHHIHAIGPGGAQRIRKAGIAAIQHQISAKLAQKGTFIGAASRSRHQRARRLGDLQRREPHSPRPAMDQHAFTWAQPGQGFQRIGSRDEGHGNGRRRFRADAGGQRLQRLGPRQRMGGEGGGRKAKHRAARRQRNPRPGFFHHARAFHAKAGAGKAIHQHILRQ